MGMTFVSPIGRFSFVNVFEPRKSDVGEDKYELVLLLPKDMQGADAETFKTIRTEVMRVAREKWPDADVKHLIKTGKIKMPIKDGDGDDACNRDGVRYQGYEGHYFIRLSRRASKGRPGVVDNNVQPILDASQVYSGCYGRCSFDVYAYDHPQGGKGVSFGLENVQKARDGEPLGGGGPAKPADQFGVIPNDAGADNPANYPSSTDGDDDWDID